MNRLEETGTGMIPPSPAPYRTTLTSSGATVVFATGRLKFPDFDDLRQQLLSLVEDGAVRVVVDLSEVESIDSGGVGALISGWKAARAAGGDLRLAARPANVASVLEIMNLDQILVAHDSSEDAFPHEA